MNFKLVVEMIWLTFIIYWLINLVGNKRTVRRAWSGSFIYILAFLIIAKFSPILSHYFEHRELPYSKLISYAGIIIMIAGLSVAIWARKTLGANWSGIPTLKENHELIRTGPFHYVRHPIYSGILLLILGNLLALGNFTSGYIFFIAFAVFVIKSRVEERLLNQQFPVEYPEYKKVTKAIIPYFW